MTEMLYALELSAQIKAELVPIALFFGMFFAVFGLGGVVVRYLPRKPGSVLDEILNEEWDDGEEDADGADGAQTPDEPPEPEQEDETAGK